MLRKPERTFLFKITLNPLIQPPLSNSTLFQAGIPDPRQLRVRQSGHRGGRGQRHLSLSGHRKVQRGRDLSQVYARPGHAPPEVSPDLLPTLSIDVPSQISVSSQLCHRGGAERRPEEEQEEAGTSGQAGLQRQPGPGGVRGRPGPGEVR